MRRIPGHGLSRSWGGLGSDHLRWQVVVLAVVAVVLVLVEVAPCGGAGRPSCSSLTTLCLRGPDRRKLPAMAEMSSEEHVDRNILDAVLSQLRASAKAGDVVWLTEEGVKVGAVVPVDVATAGLTALGRDV